MRNIGIIAHIDAQNYHNRKNSLLYWPDSQAGETHDGESIMDYLLQKRTRITISLPLPVATERDTDKHCRYT